MRRQNKTHSENMLDEKEFNRWLTSAEKTLKSAYGDTERGEYNWACFKAQQAAEFAVKALLRGLGLPSYGHSISKLLISLKEKGLNIPNEIINAGKALDKHYVLTRYPNAWTEGSPHEYYTKEDAENATQQTNLIIKWVKKLWKSLKKEKRQEKKS